MWHPTSGARKSWPAFMDLSEHGYPHTGYTKTGLLQCALPGAALEDPLETSAGA